MDIAGRTRPSATTASARPARCDLTKFLKPLADALPLFIPNSLPILLRRAVDLRFTVRRRVVRRRAGDLRRVVLRRRVVFLRAGDLRRVVLRRVVFLRAGDFRRVVFLRFAGDFRRVVRRLLGAARFTVLRRRVVRRLLGAARRFVAALRLRVVVVLRRAGARRRVVVLRRAVVFRLLVVAFLLAILLPLLVVERRALLVRLAEDLRVRPVAFLRFALLRGFRITTSCSGMTLS
jgi:hypothetical protein